MNIVTQDANGLPDWAATPEERAYRAVYYPALITLMLGLLSALALISRAFWVVPVLAVACGAASLRGLAKNPRTIGRGAARAGLVLAILFGTYAWSSQTLRDAWLGRTTRRCADQWIDLLRQQRLREAFQLHDRKDERALPGENLEDFFRRHPVARSECDRYFSVDPQRALVRAAREGRVAFERVERCETLLHELGERVVLRYVIQAEQGQGAQAQPVRITLRNRRSTDNPDRDWYIETVGPG